MIRKNWPEASSHAVKIGPQVAAPPSHEGRITWNQYQEAAELVESIPLRRARAYAEAVLRNATIYPQLYAAKAPASRAHSVRRKRAGLPPPKAQTAA
jgi:hypothetical protein